MDNRRVLLAVLLSLAVLITWQYLFMPPPETAPEPGEVPAASGDAVAGAAGEDGDRDEGSERSEGGEADAGAAAGGAGAETASEAASTEPAEPAEPAVEVMADSERRVVVENDLYRAELTNRGAQLVSFVLHRHESRDGGPVDLVRWREEGPYPFAVQTLPDEAPSALNDALFEVHESRQGDARVVLFSYSGPAGRAEKRFVFHGQGLFDVTVEVEEPLDWALFFGPGIRNPLQEELESRYERPGAVYRTDDELEREEASKLEEAKEVPGTGLDWAGLEDTYFLTAMIPRGTVSGVRIVPQVLEPVGDHRWSFRPRPPEDALAEGEEDLPRELVLLVVPDDDRLDLVSYWGAKKYKRLADLGEGIEGYEDLADHGLERTISIWSFLRPISIPILWLVLWIHDNVVQNYGWAIVLTTLVIKIILLPLTHKSYVSMRKMQELNPRMQAIRSKWRGKLRDKQGKVNFDAQKKMNEEMQALYREAGVNPAGGCLPMLLQMPVLLAFYQLLTAAVELRGAPWIFWIHDLSQADPIYVLPIIMGGTQFLQQRLTPAAGDPMQRRLMMAMPVVMTIFFLGFPAGLVLYWLTNNVLTILQNSGYNKLKKEDEPAPADKAKAQKGSKRS